MRWLILCWACVCVIPPVLAAGDGVSVRIDPRWVGVQGVVRPGAWTPMRVSLDNHGADPKRVRCRWVLNDGDGDRVYAQRVATVGPQQTHVWLYAAPSLATKAGDHWRVEVIDEAQGLALGTAQARPRSVLEQGQCVLGVTGTASLGLEPYTNGVTRHEPCTLLRGIEPSQLPDRWYGLSMLEALIWTPQGGDPGSPAISVDTHRAVRQWVRQGGHLVVVLPAVGSLWFESPLSDLLPSVRAARRAVAAPPDWLGRPEGDAPDTVYLQVLEPDADRVDGGAVSVLLRDNEGGAVVVAQSYGFGRVTLIGVDLTDPVLARMGLPNGGGLWNAVFGWRSPVYTQKYIDDQLQQWRMSEAQFRQRVDLGRFIPGLVAMREEVLSGLLVVIVFLGVYGLAAGPVGFAVLKRWGMTKYSWLVFVGVVVLGSVCAWGGAWAMRPARMAMSHFTVIDVEARTGLAKAHSWLSLLVPRHKRVRIEVAPGWEAPIEGTLSSPGMDSGNRGGGFPDTQFYEINADSPHAADVPIRATAKQFELRGVFANGNPPDEPGETTSPLGLGGRLSLEGGWPRGRLVHHGEAVLQNVLLVYCPGDGGVPVVWRHREPWPGGEALDVTRPEAFEPLVRPFSYDDSGKRSWVQEGYLGRLMGFKAGQAWGSHTTGEGNARGAAIASSEIVQAVEMLSFYNALPPPDFRHTGLADRAVNYDRAGTQGLDLTATAATRCLIVIGHTLEAFAALPLLVDGRPLPANGWTVLRWIVPIDQRPAD